MLQWGSDWAKAATQACSHVWRVTGGREASERVRELCKYPAYVRVSWDLGKLTFLHLPLFKKHCVPPLNHQLVHGFVVLQYRFRAPFYFGSLIYTTALSWKEEKVFPYIQRCSWTNRRQVGNLYIIENQKDSSIIKACVENLTPLFLTHGHIVKFFWFVVKVFQVKSSTKLFFFYFYVFLINKFY